MTAAEIDEGAVDRLLTVLGEHGRIERDLARRAIIAALPAPASIDEGAWEAAWQAFRSMCRHGYIPDKTDLGVALRAYIAALPAWVAVYRAVEGLGQFIGDDPMGEGARRLQEILAALPALAQETQG
jgi:hypothetical protein